MAIEARYVTPLVRAWLRCKPAARVLHVFDQACNLISDEGKIVSLVTAEVGPGPFAVVISLPNWQTFSQLVTAATPVTASTEKIGLGSLVIDISSASLWLPCPTWERLRQQPAVVYAHLPVLRTLLRKQHQRNEAVAAAYGRQLAAGSDLLRQGLATGEAAAIRQGARKLAGLGIGLTPAGDDFLVGVLYALWAVWPAEEARAWGGVIAETAAPRTSQLSAAWLQAAARGEASEPWHELVWACGQGAGAGGQGTLNSSQGDCGAMVAAVERILDTGYSSGADALAGFTAVLEWAAASA